MNDYASAAIQKASTAMDKQVFIGTLVEQAARSGQSAAASWAFLAEKCGWDDADLDRYLSSEVRSASGALDAENVAVAQFEWRAGIANGGH